MSLARSRLARQAALIAVCCFVCAEVVILVKSEAFGDAGALALQALGVAMLITTLVLTIRRSPPTSTRRRLVSRAPSAAAALLGVIFVAASYADVSCEIQALIETREPNGVPTSIVLGPTGEDIRLSGVIREGAARRLAQLLDDHPSVRRIHLTSEGGLSEEGQAIGDVIAARGLITYVPDYCVSACTLVLVRGRERLLQRGARVGFHAPYVEGLFGQLFQDDGSAERTAYVSAGVAPAFAARALAIASGDMWFPEPGELIAGGVATGVVDRYHFPASGLDGTATLAGARDEILQNFPMLRPLADRAPAAFDQIAGSYLDDYRRGVSDGQAVDRFRARVDAVLAGLMARAGDQTLLDVTRYLARALRATASPRECVPIGARHDLLRAAGVLARADEGAMTEAGTLVGRMLHEAGSDLGGRHRDQPQGLGLRRVSTVAGPAEALAGAMTMSCDDLRLAYARILASPDARGAAAARAMLDASAATALAGGPAAGAGGRRTNF